MENNNPTIHSDKFVYSNMEGIVITKRNGKDQHKYIPKYPLDRGLNYLIIGTIHPNSTPAIDYYYGNVGSFWKIIKCIYPNYFFDDILQIRKWQNDFKIGITDTVLQCRRKKETANDSDLILDEEDYNWTLKDYVLSNRKSLMRLLFTSGEGQNAAFKNFKKIMGTDFLLIEPLCTVLPSPSGNSTRALFKGKDEQYGLVLPFYDYLKSEHREALEKAKETFELKKHTQKQIKRLPDSQINYYEAYKVFEYAKYLPNEPL